MSIKTLSKHVLLLAAACGSAAAAAQIVEVKDAWIRGTVPAQKATGAFMEIRARNTVRLIGVESRIAESVEIHNMTMQNGIMKMSQVQGIDVPAGGTIKLAPGGYHVMFIGLKQQMKPGDRMPLKLNFELANKKRESVELSVEVRDIKGERQPMH